MLYTDSDPIYQYCETFSANPEPYLMDLERETHLKTLSPQMIAGHLQGRFLSMVSQMIKPNRILEIGTFTGYSALCLAEGLSESGKLYTIESNPELKNIIHSYIHQTPYAEKIECLFGNALHLISTIKEPIDLVWIDAAKTEYSDYYELCIDKVRAGGYLLADNVLWDGKVLKEVQDEDTEALKAFNQKIKDDPRVVQMVLPFRDGINIMRKIKESPNHNDQRSNNIQY